MADTGGVGDVDRDGATGVPDSTPAANGRMISPNPMSVIRRPPMFAIFYRRLELAVSERTPVRVSASHLFGTPQTRSVDGIPLKIITGADGRERVVLQLGDGPDATELRLLLERIESVEVLQPGAPLEAPSQFPNQDRIETKPRRAISVEAAMRTKPTPNARRGRQTPNPKG